MIDSTTHDRLGEILEAARVALEPIRQRLAVERDETWSISVAAPRADGRLGCVELAGRPVPPDDRQQWAVFWVDPVESGFAMGTELDAWEDRDEGPHNNRTVDEEIVPAEVALARVPILIGGLDAELEATLAALAHPGQAR